MTTRTATETLPIPDSHLDLLTRPLHGVLTTMGADGQPESSLVWVDLDDKVAVVNTTLERQKGRNMLANSKVNLLVVDPKNTSRFIQIRGDAELTTNGARDHIDAITRKYTDHPAFYGYVYPIERRGRPWSSAESAPDGSPSTPFTPATTDRRLMRSHRSPRESRRGTEEGRTPRHRISTTAPLSRRETGQLGCRSPEPTRFSIGRVKDVRERGRL